MFRFATPLASLLLVACAAPRTSSILVAGELDGGVSHARPEADPAPGLEPAPLPALLAVEPAATPPAVEPIPALLAEESLHGSRFTLKGGYWGSDEDTLDDGYIFNASWMRFFTRFFALEFEAGYLDGEGEDGGVDADVWSVPLFVNGRLNAPLWILDLYGGAGVGGFYYDAEASSGGVTVDDDGFLWAGNVFLGATVNVADRIALGLEAKYYLTDDIDDFDEGLDGYALMLTLGWSR